jgi:hypothetical protein
MGTSRVTKGSQCAVWMLVLDKSIVVGGQPHIFAKQKKKMHARKYMVTASQKRESQ